MEEMHTHPIRHMDDAIGELVFYDYLYLLSDSLL